MALCNERICLESNHAYWVIVFGFWLLYNQMKIAVELKFLGLGIFVSVNCKVYMVAALKLWLDFI
jgi:uncharacterized membrane protein YccF (DUF307 family)